MFPGGANIAQKEKPLLVSWEPMLLLHTFGRAGHGVQSVPIILQFSRSASVVIAVAFCLHIDPSPYHRGKAPEDWLLSSWGRHGQLWEAVVLRQWFMEVRGGSLHHTGNEEADRLLSWTEWYCGKRYWCNPPRVHLHTSSAWLEPTKGFLASSPYSLTPYDREAGHTFALLDVHRRLQDQWRLLREGAGYRWVLSQAFLLLAYTTVTFHR